jgi:hypothetical protein
MRTIAVKTLQNLDSNNKYLSELTDSIILLDHCACSDVAKIVHNQLNAMQWEVLRHATYSLGLLQCNLHVFGLLKKIHKVCTSTLDDAVQVGMVLWFRHQLKEHFADIFTSLE